MIYNLYEKRSEKNANIHDLTKIQKKPTLVSIRYHFKRKFQQQKRALQFKTMSIVNALASLEKLEIDLEAQTRPSDSSSFCCQKWQFPVRNKNYDIAGKKVMQNSYQFKERRGYVTKHVNIG